MRSAPLFVGFLLVHTKTGPRALIKGYELILGPICAYEDRSRPRQLKSVVRISSWRGKETPQDDTGAVVSASNSQGAEESGKDTKTAHKTNEDDQGKHKKLRDKIWEFLRD